MKKIILKFLAVLTLSIVCIFFSAPIVTTAEAPQENVTSESVEKENIVPETEWSVLFKEKVLPHVLEYGAAALGVLTAVLVSLKRLRITISELVGAYKALKKSNEDNEKTKTDVTSLMDSVQEWQKNQAELQRAFMEQQAVDMQAHFEKHEKIMEDRFKEIALTVVDKIEDAVETAHKILDVEEIAFEENPALVSNGTAKKISEVIHNGEEKKNDA